MLAKPCTRSLATLATAVLLSITSLPASALSLGRVTVQSALGEPLKAEIDFLDINAEEAASLSARVAAPDAFKAAGLEYNAALSSTQTSLQRRPNGRPFLKLGSDRIVNAPYVDIILEATWNSGRIVRDYTLLFDPPNLRIAEAKTPDPSQLPIQETAPTDAPAVAPAPQAERSNASANAPVAPVAPAKPVVTAPTAQPAAQPAAPAGQTLRVQYGQTAGQIAAAHRPTNVSLDQMLVAMLHSNPQAFIQGNVNRLKAGAILSLPAQPIAQTIPAEEATRIVIAQSRDFNEFRRKLANNVALTGATPTGHEAAGKVQASVRDKKPTANTPDKLTLSKGAVQGKSGEDQLATARNAAQTNARAAELAKNITDLNKLAAAASAPQPASSTALASTLATSAVALPASPVSQPAASASAPVPASTPEPTFIDTLLADPLLPAGVTALLALLTALGFYKVRQRKNGAPLGPVLSPGGLSESSAESASDQGINRSDSLTNGAAMAASPSQLDASAEVDPVAEADVYLAYGRDLQAEEILKNALRSTPERLAIYIKLTEIYAKRKDAKALEAVATQAFDLTDGSGPQWEQICENGLSIDPDNALYLPGGQPDAGPATQFDPNLQPEGDAFATEASEIAAARAQADAVTSQPGALQELDLNLDFSLEEPAETPAQASDRALQSLPPEQDRSEPSSLPSDDPGVVQSDPDSIEPANKNPNDILSFDLNSLSLDLTDERTAPQDLSKDRLETKLALADEFRAIGDADGARALIEEVVAEATGATKAKAQQALNKL